MTYTRSISASDLAAATPPGRDRFVDLTRLACIAVVVVGHWLLVLVVHDGTTAPGRSPMAQAATWLLMVMPVFFAVGGYGHARALASPRHRSYASFVLSRADRLLGPVLVLVAAWSALAVLLEVTGLARGPVAAALDSALSPLWFVGVYLVVALVAPVMWAAHRRWGVRVLVPLVVSVVVVDVARSVSGVEAVGLVNVVLVWVALHQLGFFWSDGTLTVGRRPLALAAAGWGAALVLTVVTGWYPVDMQGLPGHAGSNFSPPTVALSAHGAGLVGLVLTVREPVGRWLRGARPWAAVVTGNSVAVTAHCWHLTAAFVVLGGMMLGGVMFPSALTATWWAVVPFWLILCAGVLGLLLRIFARGERWSVAATGRGTGDSGGAGAVDETFGVRCVAGVAVVAVCVFGLSQVGLDGMVSGAVEPVAGVDVAVWVLVAGLAGGSLVLRGRRAPTYGRAMSAEPTSEASTRPLAEPSTAPPGGSPAGSADGSPGTSPDASPVNSALTRDWIVCALVGAAARFVPVPILDDAIADRAVREAVRRTLRAHGRDFPLDAVAPLYRGQHWAVNAAMGLVKLPLKLLLFPARKVMRIVGAVHGVPTDITRILALAHTTDRVLADGRLSGEDRDGLQREARDVRSAFDAVLGAMDLRLIRGAVADTLSGVRGLSDAVIAYARDRFDRDRTSGHLDPGGLIAVGVTRLQEALRRPEIRRQIAEFDERFDRRLAGTR